MIDRAHYFERHQIAESEFLTCLEYGAPLPPIGAVIRKEDRHPDSLQPPIVRHVLVTAHDWTLRKGRLSCDIYGAEVRLLQPPPLDTGTAFTVRVRYQGQAWGTLYRGVVCHDQDRAGMMAQATEIAEALVEAMARQDPVAVDGFVIEAVPEATT